MSNVSDLLDSVPKGLWLGGKLVPAEKTFAVYNPATGEELAQVADATAADGIRALDLAAAAEEYVAGSHVSVGESCRVQSGEPLRDLFTDPQGLGELEATNASEERL